MVYFDIFSGGDDRSRALFRVRGSLPKRWAGLRMVDLGIKTLAFTMLVLEEMFSIVLLLSSQRRKTELAINTELDED